MKKLSMILPLALILCFMVSCQEKEAKAELEEMKAQAKVEEQNKELVKRQFEAWEKGDFEAYKEVVAPDYYFYSPSNNPKPMSREEQIEAERLMFGAFPDLNLRIEKLFAVGDSVIIWGIGTGTHQGEFQGIQATSNKIEFGNIIIMSLKSGKIVEAREEPNVLAVMQQIGMELKPKEGEK